MVLPSAPFVAFGFILGVVFCTLLPVVRQAFSNSRRRRSARLAKRAPR